jgi:hypothetical protein
MKRRAMNGMNRWKSQLMGGKPSENPGLGAVRVNQIGLISLQSTSDRVQCFPVLKRVQTASQLGQNPNVQPTFSCSLLKGTLTSHRVARQEANFIVKQMMLIVDIEKRVFLRAADDHSSNYMGNSHNRKDSKSGFWGL